MPQASETEIDAYIKFTTQRANRTVDAQFEIETVMKKYDLSDAEWLFLFSMIAHNKIEKVLGEELARKAGSE